MLPILVERRETMTAIKNHEDLVFWQLSEKLRVRVFAFTAKPQAAKHRDFCDDIRRSARSAPAVIAEGFYRFRPHDNANFVRMALGSLGETKNHLTEARKEHYIDEEEFRTCWRLAVRAVGAGNGYHAYLRSCPADGPHSFFDPQLRARTDASHSEDQAAQPKPASARVLDSDSDSDSEPEPEPEPEP
jgi:four helix bundle protein